MLTGISMSAYIVEHTCTVSSPSTTLAVACKDTLTAAYIITV